MSEPFVCTGCEQTVETFKAGVCRSCDENYAYSLLPLCGCGDPEAVMNVYRDVLADCAGDTWPRPFRSMAGWPSEARQIVLYTLDVAGLLDHGGSVFGAWTTDKGNLALDVLNAILSQNMEGRS